VSPNLIRRIIAHKQLDARRIGCSRSIRIDRESLLQLGRFLTWASHDAPLHHDRGSCRLLADQ
jgi:hypothetical protein